MMFQDIYADFKSERLANGLSVYFKQWPSASWFYAGIIVHAGAREDPFGRSGLAHLVEHLVSENVTPLTFAELEKAMKALGGEAWLGATNYAFSEYKVHMPNEEHRIHQALNLFGQMLFQPKELTRSIEEEKAVVLREYHQLYEHEQAREWALQGRHWLFENHPCLPSFHQPIGVPDGFMGSSGRDIQRFYDTYYTPQNSSVVCIGGLEWQTLRRLLEETPFAVQREGQRNPLPEPFHPTSPQRHEQIIHLSELTQFTQWEADISFEWVLPLHFQRECVRLFCYLVKERLFEELRYQLHLTYDIVVETLYYQDCRTLRVTFKTDPASVEKACDIVWQVLRTLDRAEATYQEAKQALIWSIYRMDYSGYDLLEYAMSDLAAYHQLIPFSEEIRKTEHTRFEHLVELARYLTPERGFCFVLQP